MSSYVVRDATTLIQHPWSRLSYRRPGLVVHDLPTAVASFQDPDSSVHTAAPEGTVLQVLRDEVVEFRGLVERRVRGGSTQTGSTTELHLVHTGYRKLQRLRCDTYDYDEAGGVGVLDMVHRNPWRYFIFRYLEGTLDDFGQPPGTDGVRVEDAARCLIGTRFIAQVDFTDNSVFLPSDIVDAANNLQVYMDEADGDNRPALQRVRQDPNGLLAPGGVFIESIPLENGDPDVDAMGTVTVVRVTLIGKRSGLDDPILEVCRNARSASKIYTPVTLTPEEVAATTFTKWTGTVNLTNDAGDAQNSLGFRISLEGTAASATGTKVYYLKLDATTSSDTGVTEGDIESYDDPYSTAFDAELVEDDYAGLTRAEALERLRRGTLSDALLNASPHWDVFIDESDRMHFRERRGTDRSLTLSPEDGQVEDLRETREANQLAYQVVALGGGRGRDQIRIVDRTAFTSGGLYDASRDPASGALYGNLPGVLTFTDDSIKSASELHRRARAELRLRRDPIRTYTGRLKGFQDPGLDTGDGFTLKVMDWGLEEVQRVVDLWRDVDPASGESVRVMLGVRVDDIRTVLTEARLLREGATSREVPEAESTAPQATLVKFDKNVYGRLIFTVPEDATIVRAILHLKQVPYETETQSGKTQFKGDTPGANPVFSSGIQFAVDPTLDAFDTPTLFSTERHPIRIGNQDAPKSISVDVTNYLRTFANGVAEPGTHAVYFLSIASANNASGVTGLEAHVEIQQVEAK